MEAQKYTMSKFRDLERQKIIVQAMRAKNVSSNLIIPPAKVEEYYRKHRDQFANKAQVKLRMIMIPGHADSGGGAAQSAMVEEIRAKLITGADFDKMAQMYSEDSTRDLGGDWGWIDDKTLSAPLSEVAFSLPPGAISKVVDVGGNHYILKVEARQGGEVKPLKDVRADIESRLAAGSGARVARALARQSALEGLYQDLLAFRQRFADDYCATCANASASRWAIRLASARKSSGRRSLRGNCPRQIIGCWANRKGTR